MKTMCIKKNLVKLILVILSGLILVCGISIAHWKCNQTKNAKLEIAELLEISNVDSNNIEEDMRCRWSNSIITIKYKGECIYYADMCCDNKLRVWDLQSAKPLQSYGVYYESREANDTDWLILENIDEVDAGGDAIIDVPIIIVSTFACIIFVWLIPTMICDERKKNTENNA